MTARLCPTCQNEIPENAPEGLCPGCLLRAATELPAESSPSAEPDIPSLGDLPRLFPGYGEFAEVGRGGMGVVFRATHNKLGRTVAIKILPRRDKDHAEFAARFEREARALAQLDHPNILTLHDFGEAEEWAFLVTEFVAGEDLRARLRRRDLSVERALEILRQITDGLAYAHARGVIHRDIKPENILVGAEGRVRIADFGLARVRGDIAVISVTQSNQVVGTPNYMAPELRGGGAVVDARSDVFALGVVAYELLTADLPVGNFQRPSQRVALDPTIDRIVLRALDPDPAARFRDAGEMLAEIDSVAAAPQASAPGRIRRAVYRIAAPETLDALGLAAVGTGGVLAFVAGFFPWMIQYQIDGSNQRARWGCAWDPDLNLSGSGLPPALLCVVGLMLAIVSYRLHRNGRRWLPLGWIGAPLIASTSIAASALIEATSAREWVGVPIKGPFLDHAIGAGSALAFGGFVLATVGAIVTVLGSPKRRDTSAR
jgi:Protein kinase domain